MTRTMTAFVARETEVARLAAALARAADGEPSLVLLGADAGIGKSRLISHVTERLVADGATAVTASCVDLGDVGLPYLPFADALVQLHADEATRDALVEVARTPTGPGPAPPWRRRPAPARSRTSRAASSSSTGSPPCWLPSAAPGHPLLLSVEDLHWADPSSRDVLRYLVARMRDEHVLVVASYRTDDLHRSHPLRPFLGELWRHPRVERLDLAPFTAGELRAVRDGRRTAARCRSPTCTACSSARRATPTSPRSCIEAGAGSSALPWSLADVLRVPPRAARPGRAAARAHRLGRGAHGQRAPAACRGRRSTCPAQGRWTCSCATPCAAHLLGGEDGRIAFRHALLAEAVYADLLPG